MKDISRKKNLRILVLTPTLGCGGAERVARDISVGLLNRGHDVAIFTNLEAPIVYPVVKGIKLFSNPQHRFCIFAHEYRNFESFSLVPQRYSFFAK